MTEEKNPSIEEEVLNNEDTVEETPVCEEDNQQEEQAEVELSVEVQLMKELDEKQKELIALAIAVSQRCDACIGFHTKALIKLGATREEIAETLGVCIYMGGGPSYMYAAEAMSAFEEFSK